MALTAAQQEARAGRVTASFIPYLMKGDEKRILEKWRELVGDPAYQRVDEIDPWLSHYGTVMEAILLDWRQRKTGAPIGRRGEVVYHREKPWAACTLDGFSANESAVIQCKTAHRWRNVDQLVPHYTWQVLFEVGCTGAERGILYISDGGLEPQDYEVARDPVAEAAMWERAEAFNRCLETLTPPFALPAMAAPVKAEKIVDMRSSNSWAEHAATWLRTREPAKENETATKELKALVPADAARTFGHGVTIARDKANRLSVRETKP
jgi:hypothetical protein